MSTNFSQNLVRYNKEGTPVNLHTENRRLDELDSSNLRYTENRSLIELYYSIIRQKSIGASLDSLLHFFFQLPTVLLPESSGYQRRSNLFTGSVPSGMGKINFRPSLVILDTTKTKMDIHLLQVWLESRVRIELIYGLFNPEREFLSAPHTKTNHPQRLCDSALGQCIGVIGKASRFNFLLQKRKETSFAEKQVKRYWIYLAEVKNPSSSPFITAEKLAVVMHCLIY